MADKESADLVPNGIRRENIDESAACSSVLSCGRDIGCDGIAAVGFRIVLAAARAIGGAVVFERFWNDSQSLLPGTGLGK